MSVKIGWMGVWLSKASGSRLHTAGVFKGTFSYFGSCAILPLVHDK